MNKTSLILLLVITFSVVSVPITYCRVSSEVLISDQSNSDYRIKAGDLLDIRIFPGEWENTKVEVDDSGMITIPLIDKVKACDLTLIDLEAEIKSGLKKYLKNPKVKIRIIKKGN